jgi:uncharacterized protein DUF6252
MTRVLKLGIFVVLTAWIYSCSHESSYEGPVPGSSDTSKAGNFTAVVNNNSWASVQSTEDASIYKNILSTITGTSSDNKQIRLSLSGTTTGQYILDQHSASYISYIEGNSGNTTPYTTYDGADTSLAGGVVNVTAIDTVNKTISGNFQCKVFRNMDSHQQIITAGIFSQIPYVVDLPLAALGDTFLVKIDGVEWIPPSNGASITNSGLTVAGSERDASKNVGLLMPINIPPGTYKLDYSAGVIFGEYSPNATTLLISDTSGRVTIIENNTLARRIRGNFQFIARDLLGSTPDSATISEGYFSLGY